MNRPLRKVLRMSLAGIPLLMAGCGHINTIRPDGWDASLDPPSADIIYQHDDPRTPHASTQPIATARQVSIDNFTFAPAELTVPAGSTVTWLNHDDVPHTATSTGSPPLFNSGALDTDQQFSFVFKQPGTYAYFCAVHPHMTGKIIVR